LKRASAKRITAVIPYYGSARQDRKIASRTPITAKLVADLRQHIKALASFQIFSKEYLHMIDSLQHIAAIASMEERLASNNTANKEGTLWDKEELVVRFLLEEGKINLCLRNMRDFKEFVRKVQKDSSVIDQYVSSTKSDTSTLMNRLLIMEVSLGVLLKLCFNAVECLQLVDCPLLIQYISEVLSFAVENPQIIRKEIEKSQENLVLEYLSSLMKNIERLQEDRIMTLLDQHKIVQLTISHISINLHNLSRASAVEGAIFLDGVVTSEDFQTHKERFTSKESEALLVKFPDLYLNESNSKPKLRQLLQYIERLKVRGVC